MKTMYFVFLLLGVSIILSCGEDEPAPKIYKYSEVRFDDTRFFTYEGTQLIIPFLGNQSEIDAYHQEINEAISFWKDTLTNDLFIENFTLLDETMARITFKNNFINATYADFDGTLVINGDVKSKITINEEKTFIEWKLITLVQGDKYFPFDSNVVDEDLNLYPIKQDIEFNQDLIIGDTVKIALLSLVYNLE